MGSGERSIGGCCGYLLVNDNDDQARRISCGVDTQFEAKPYQTILLENAKNLILIQTKSGKLNREGDCEISSSHCVEGGDYRNIPLNHHWIVGEPGRKVRSRSNQPWNAPDR